MDYLVIVREEAPQRFSAQAVGIPEVRASASTEAEALDRIRTSLAEWFASARLVRVQVDTVGDGNPWLDSFGRSAVDPDFGEVLAEIEEARSANNA